MKAQHKVSQELIKKLKDINFPFYGNEEDVSVMEMLDVIPSEIRELGYLEIWHNGVAYTKTQDNIRYCTERFASPLPNALAEMILWLYENKHISFNK